MIGNVKPFLLLFFKPIHRGPQTDDPALQAAVFMIEIKDLIQNGYQI